MTKTARRKPKDDGGIDQRLVKALGHPIRVQILTILNERIASPNEIAKEIGASLGTVSYHVRLLAELECLELMETVPRRGAVEHYYRATVRPWFEKDSWGKLPRSARAAVSTEAVQAIVERMAAALSSGAFDSRDDRHLSRTPLMLDEQAWQELARLLDELLERALALKAESAERAIGSGEAAELLSCDLVVAHYGTASVTAATEPSASRR